MICHWCRFLLIGIFGLGFISSIAEQITQADVNFVPTTDSITDGFDVIATGCFLYG